MSVTSYDEVCAGHRWEVPARYNIAADVCDKHPRHKPAMIWESFDGATGEFERGELQDLANQAAHTLSACGVRQGDRVAVVLPATPEAAAIFFGVWKLGAILLSMSVLYGDDAIEHRLSDRAPSCSSPTPATRRASTDRGRQIRSCSSPIRWQPPQRISFAPTPRPTTLRSSITRPGRRAREGDRPRAPLHPRPRGVPLLP